MKQNVKYLIIGNGVAGCEAALAIRKSDPKVEITIISESEHLFYYRPKLIDYLAGETTLDEFTIHQKEFYEKQDIKNVLGTKVVKIVPEENVAVSEDGTKHRYDKLLIATGADCLIPSINGVNKKGVFEFTGVRDADNIKEYCKDITDLVVIGGGLLGLETAHSLKKLGKNVTVIEVFDRLLPKQLDDEGAGLLKRLLEEKGLSFVLPADVTSVEGDGRVESVILRSGQQISAGAVIICTGIRPRVGLAKEAAATVGKGIVVNDHMQTSIENIYCAGDSAEHDGRLYGFWNPAREQGKIAGLNMAGVPTQYRGTVSSSALKITGIDVYSAGDFDAENAEALISKNENVYRKFVLRDDQPLGAIVVGDSEAVKSAASVFEDKAAVEEFKKHF
jgi:nitrite reductase (NADH) large subunit